MRKIFVSIACALAIGCTSPSEVQLPKIISDGMVLQREQPVVIWGTTTPNASVKVNFQGKSTKVYADAEGNWKAVLPEAKVGGPYTMNINGKKLSDILVGDVFIGSGQSNMELTNRSCLDVVAEDLKGYTNSNIRYFNVPQYYDFNRQCEDLPSGAWESLDSEEQALNWSALCYFTARYLQEAEPGVPVGMINASLGGSPIESWIQESALYPEAVAKSAPFKNQEYHDSVANRNRLNYIEWEQAYRALPENKSAKWHSVDIFSDSWAKDAQGKNILGGHHFRTSVSLDSTQLGDAMLRLGNIIDADSVFVNGQFVGNSTYRYLPRYYKIPEGLLKEGANSIEISLYCYGGEGTARFVPEKKYRLETSNGIVNLETDWEHKSGKRAQARAGETFIRWQPYCLYNAMIAPLKNYRTCGIMWYQGEANLRNASDYGELLESMILDWRKEMDNDSLEFHIVELANYEHSELKGENYPWNIVCKEQKETAQRMENVNFIPNADLGEWNDIHPQDKKTLGARMAKSIIENR